MNGQNLHNLPQIHSILYSWLSPRSSVRAMSVKCLLCLEAVVTSTGILSPYKISNKSHHPGLEKISPGQWIMQVTPTAAKSRQEMKGTRRVSRYSTSPRYSLGLQLFAVWELLQSEDFSYKNLSSLLLLHKLHLITHVQK